jgi:hypothetical protein
LISRIDYQHMKPQIDDEAFILNLNCLNSEV